MNIKILTLPLSVLLLTLALSSCEKQNMVEAIEVKSALERSEEYFANLRTYKKTNHQVFFGWFGGIAGNNGDSNVLNVLDRIPDSVDIVSLWGGFPAPGKTYTSDLIKKTQKLKGTKFTVTLFLNGFDALKFPSNEEGIKMYADTLLKQVDQFGLDGLDIDYENGIVSIFSDFNNLILLVKELGKYLGPKSGTDKLLIMDSFFERLPPEVAPYLSYYVVQAYSPQGGNVASLPNRFAQASGMPFEKCIAAENFEAAWSSGGLLTAYAAWNPPSGRKGGVGAFHAEYEFANGIQDYLHARRAIQIMNPAAK